MGNKKFLTLAITATFVLSSFAPFAGATTVEELQAQINALLQQIAALQGTTVTTGTSLCLTKTLKLGMTDAEVKTLQQGLNKDTATTVATTGAGSLGNETTYYGALTQTAVIKFQEKYAADILAPLGLTKGTGIFAAATRTKFNALYCTPTTPVTPTTPTTTVTTVAGTEGTLTATKSPTFVETTLKKGDTDKPVVAAKLEAKNSDITVKRIDYTITGTAIQPWKTYTKLDLYVDGTLVKSVPALKENFIENTYGTNYLLRYDGVSIIVPKGGSKDVVLKVSVQESPVNINPGTITLLASPSAIRGIDGLGIDQYAPAANIASATFAALSTSSTGSLTVSLNANSPKTGYIVGSQTSVTSDVKAADFDLKATDRAVTIKTLNVTVTDAGGIISAVKLYDGTTLVGSAAYVAETAAPAGTGDLNGDGEDASSDKVATFNNLSILIAKDTTKTLTVKVDLKPIDGTTITEGLTFKTDIVASATAIVASDDNDNLLTNLYINGNNDANSDGTDADTEAPVIIAKILTAYTKAPLLTFVSAKINKTTQAGQDDQADAEIVFDVTAQGGDIYFYSPAGGGGTAITVDDGMETHTNYSADNDPAASDNGIGTYMWSTTAEASGTPNVYLIRSGQTARITVSGHISIVGVTGYTNMALDTFTWGTDTTPTEYTANSGLDSGSTATYDLSQFKTEFISMTRVSA